MQRPPNSGEPRSGGQHHLHVPLFFPRQVHKGYCFDTQRFADVWNSRSVQVARLFLICHDGQATSLCQGYHKRVSTGSTLTSVNKPRILTENISDRQLDRGVDGNKNVCIVECPFKNTVVFSFKFDAYFFRSHDTEIKYQLLDIIPYRREYVARIIPIPRIDEDACVEAIRHAYISLTLALSRIASRLGKCFMRNCRRSVKSLPVILSW